MKFAKLLFNPYEKLSEKFSLTLGILSVFIISVSSYAVGGMFSDILNFTSAKNVPLAVVILLGVSNAALLCAVFFLISIILSRSKVRFIDVAGFVLFAQIPLIATPLCFASDSLNIFLDIPPNATNEWILSHWTFKSGLLMCVSFIFFIWSMVLLFKAVKVAANLGGWRLWTTFIAGLVLSTSIMRLFIFPAILKTNFNQCDSYATENSAPASTVLNKGVSVSGTYEGTLKFPMQTLRFRLYMDNSNKLNVYATSPDQSPAKIPIEDLKIQGLSLTFSIPALGVKFHGKVSPDAAHINGTFEQHGFKVPLNMLKL